MLNIYAQTFMTATRTPCVRLRDLPASSPKARRRWIFGSRTRCVDPGTL